MLLALDQFRISISRVRDLIAIHNTVKAQATSEIDFSDLLRAALVLAVSALDYYVHEVVTLGMVEIHQGKRPEPTAFARFQVSLGNARQERLMALTLSDNELQQLVNDSCLQEPYTISALLPVISNSILNRLNNSSWLEKEIREKLSYQSFQQPDKIADAIRYISDKKLWEEVAMQLDISAKDVKEKLSPIIGRRNQIAHEADINPTLDIGNRWPIDEMLVSDAVDFLEQLVESIHTIL